MPLLFPAAPGGVSSCRIRACERPRCRLLCRRRMATRGTTLLVLPRPRTMMIDRRSTTTSGSPNRILLPNRIYYLRREEKRLSARRTMLDDLLLLRGMSCVLKTTRNCSPPCHSTCKHAPNHQKHVARPTALLHCCSPVRARPGPRSSPPPLPALLLPVRIAVSVLAPTPCAVLCSFFVRALSPTALSVLVPSLVGACSLFPPARPPTPSSPAGRAARRRRRRRSVGG